MSRDCGNCVRIALPVYSLLHRGVRLPDERGTHIRLLQALGELIEAEKLLCEALQGRREELGDRHPSTLMSINNLGRLLRARGQLTEAENLCDENA